MGTATAWQEAGVDCAAVPEEAAELDDELDDEELDELSRRTLRAASRR